MAEAGGAAAPHRSAGLRRTPSSRCQAAALPPAPPHPQARSSPAPADLPGPDHGPGLSSARRPGGGHGPRSLGRGREQLRPGQHRGTGPWGPPRTRARPGDGRQDPQPARAHLSWRRHGARPAGAGPSPCRRRRSGCRSATARLGSPRPFPAGPAPPAGLAPASAASPPQHQAALTKPAPSRYAPPPASAASPRGP